VADGDMPGQATERFFVEDLGDQPHAGVDLDAFTVRSSDAGALLPAVLESEKGEICKAGDVLVRGVNTENTAGFSQNTSPYNRLLMNIDYYKALYQAGQCVPVIN
jgi:hypothetical protein